MLCKSWKSEKNPLPRCIPLLGIGALCVLLFLTAACKDNPNAGNTPLPAGETRTFKDMLGNTVSVPKNTDRIALLGGPTGQIAYLLGAQDKLCAVTGSIATSELVILFDPSIKNRPAVRTVNGMVNIEKLLKSNPQLVIAGTIDGQIVQKKTNLPVAFFDDSISHNVSDIEKEIGFYATAFGAEERGRAYIHYLKKMIRFVKERTDSIPAKDRKVVFNGYSTSHLVTVGGDTFIQERLEIAGCKNAAESIKTSGKKEGLHAGLGEVSMEQVLAWNPDIIVIDMGSPEELINDERWKSVKAVKRKKVFIQPAGVFIWDRPTAEAAVLHPLWLAKTAYPERFKDVSFTKEVQRFYREIFKFNLNEKQAQMVETGSFKNKIMRGIK